MHQTKTLKLEQGNRFSGIFTTYFSPLKGVFLPTLARFYTLAHVIQLTVKPATTVATKDLYGKLLIGKNITSIHIIKS